MTAATPLPALLQLLTLALAAAAATTQAVTTNTPFAPLRAPCHPSRLHLAFTGELQAASGAPPPGACPKAPPSHAGRHAAAHPAALPTLPHCIADTGYS